MTAVVGSLPLGSNLWQAEEDSLLQRSRGYKSEEQKREWREEDKWAWQRRGTHRKAGRQGGQGARTWQAEWTRVCRKGRAAAELASAEAKTTADRSHPGQHQGQESESEWGWKWRRD